MATFLVSDGDRVSRIGFGEGTSRKGYSYLTGSRQVRNFMLKTAKDYKTYNSWMKAAAQIVAAESRRLAPIDAGRLASKMVGRASARVTDKTGRKRSFFGGVVVGGTIYSKSVSFGRYYKAGQYEVKRSKDGPPFIGYRSAEIRTKGNPFMRKARDASRPNVVEYWNRQLKMYIERNGYQYQMKG